MEKRGFFWWLIFALLFIWQLPQNLVAIIMLPFLGRLKMVACRHYSFMFEGTNMQGGISLGNFCFGSPSLCKSEVSIMHELDGHTVDSKILGPLYLLVIGLPSVLNAGFGFTKCYYDFYTEKWANEHSDLTTDQRCRLIKKP